MRVAQHAAHLVQRVRYLILGGLLILSVLAWALLIWQSSTMSNQAMSLTMGMSAFLFIAIWILMMVAMMFPTAAPMILMFTKIYARKRQQGNPFVPTWVFVSAYLLVWSIFGAVAYPLAAGIDKLAAQSMWHMENVVRFGGVILLVAGRTRPSSATAGSAHSHEENQRVAVRRPRGRRSSRLRLSGQSGGLYVYAPPRLG
jgi:predicted metal-binding membrane protein